MSILESFNSKIVTVFKTKELRDKVVFTLIMFMVARIGTLIPAPGVDIDRLSEMGASNDLLGYINMFSGGAFLKVSMFSLGVVPYINASIVMSMIGSIIPKMEEIQKEGESGRARISQWTRYVTIVIAILQAFTTCLWLQSYGFVNSPGIMFFLVTITTLTAGTVFLMWIGEQITINGIGNGVSLLIFLNIVSRAPSGIIETITMMKDSKYLIPVLIIVGVAGILTIMGVATFQLGQRKIPIHYVGKGFSSRAGMKDKSYIPLKLNTAGVMPVIFGSILMAAPTLIISLLPNGSTKIMLSRWFTSTHPVYLSVFAVIIIFFTFFYTAITFDPEKVAQSLKQGGGTIPGIRPGTETVEYLENVVTRITWGGAIMLAAISVLPVIIFTSLGLPVFFAGTGVIIVVGVCLETLQQINAQLIVRDYKGFI